MSDFESLGDAIKGNVGRKRHDERGARGRTVDGSRHAIPPLSRRDEPNVLEDEQLEGPRNAVISFRAQECAQADERAMRHPASLSGRSSMNDVCPICKGANRLRRDVPYGHPDFGKAVVCVCKERELREKRRRKMIALSEQFGFQREQVLSNFRRQVRGVQKAYQETEGMVGRLVAWAKRRDGVRQTKDAPALPQEWLLLRGPVGTGKTHLAMAITNACIDAGMIALFATIPDLLDHLRATYNPSSEAVYDELFLQLRDAEVLVLDDLGAQRSSPWADEKVFQLINYRYNFGWPTIITLNTRAWSYLDERISSRLQDAALVLLVDMSDAQDYRLRQRKNVARRRTPSVEGSVNSDL